MDSYGLVLIDIGPLTLEQQLNRISDGLPFRVFCSFLEAGLIFSEPLKTLTAQVPQIPAPPQFPRCLKSRLSENNLIDEWYLFYLLTWLLKDTHQFCLQAKLFVN